MYKIFLKHTMNDNIFFFFSLLLLYLRNTGSGILDPKEILIPSLSLLESETLLTQASTEILLSLSKQLNVTCRTLTTDEARTFVEHVTCTYGPLRDKT